MKLVGAGGQYDGSQFLYDLSGTITTGSTAQLIIPRSRSRSSFIIQNISATNMYIEIGGARATASLSTGTVTSCSVTNAGFGYSLPPIIKFLGGAYENKNQVTPTYSVVATPDFPSPSKVATAHCVMSGSAPNMTVGSIVIDNPGAGYAYPPYVFLENDRNDPYGAAVPSATNGILLLANGGSYNPDGTITTTDAISVFCTATSAAYCCKFSF